VTNNPFRYIDASNTYANTAPTLKIGVITLDDGSQVLIDVWSNDTVRVAFRTNRWDRWGMPAEGKLAPG
jgi:hypothetical protein